MASRVGARFRDGEMAVSGARSRGGAARRRAARGERGARRRRRRRLRRRLRRRSVIESPEDRSRQQRPRSLLPLRARTTPNRRLDGRGSHPPIRLFSPRGKSGVPRERREPGRRDRPGRVRRALEDAQGSEVATDAAPQRREHAPLPFSPAPALYDHETNIAPLTVSLSRSLSLFVLCGVGHHHQLVPRRPYGVGGRRRRAQRRRPQRLRDRRRQVHARWARRNWRLLPVPPGRPGLRALRHDRAHLDRLHHAHGQDETVASCRVARRLVSRVASCRASPRRASASPRSARPSTRARGGEACLIVVIRGACPRARERSHSGDRSDDDVRCEID